MRDQMAKGKNGRVERAGWSGRWATAVAPSCSGLLSWTTGHAWHGRDSEHSGVIIVVEGPTWNGAIGRMMAFAEVEIWRWAQGISKVDYSADPMGAAN